MAGSSNDSRARRPGGVLSVFRRKPRHLARPAAKRSPVRNTLIALAALLPVVSVLAVTSPASAHANTVSGKVACQADGTWTVTWTVANDYDATVQVTLNDTTGKTSLPASSGGGTLTGLPADLAKKGSTTVVQSSIPAATTTARLTVTGVWSDKYTQADTGTVTMTGTCLPSHTAAAPTFHQPTCTVALGSIDIPADAGVSYKLDGKPVSAGTITDVPVGPHTVTASSTTLTLTGTTSWSRTFAAPVDNCPAPLTAPVVTQPTCDAQQGSFTKPTDTANVTYTVNGNVVTATTQAPYRFSATTGWVIAEGGRSATYTVTYTTLDNCPAPLTAPVVTQPTCDAQHGSFTKPADTANVKYTVSGNVVTATTAAPYTFSATKGWVIAEGGRSATYTVTYTPLDNCPAPLTPPTVTQPTCTNAQGSFTAPTSTTTVTYAVSGNVVTATTKAPYTFSTTTGWAIASGARTATFTVAFTAPSNCPPVEQAPVLAPKPSITKTVNVGDATTVAAGDQLTYTVTLGNTGNAPATGDVVDTLPANVDPVAGSFTKDGVAVTPASITATSITWTGVTVPAGQTVTLVYQVTVLDAAAGTTLVNKATWLGLSASVTDSVAVATIPSTGGGLAHTGAPFNPWSLLLWASVFLALGVMFLVFGRRNDEQEN